MCGQSKAKSRTGGGLTAIDCLSARDAIRTRFRSLVTTVRPVGPPPQVLRVFYEKSLAAAPALEPSTLRKQQSLPEVAGNASSFVVSTVWAIVHGVFPRERLMVTGRGPALG
jgi:hypothetical protein